MPSSQSIIRMLGIMLVALLLLGTRLGYQSFWIDESLTIGPAVAASGIGDLLREVQRWDTQPPLSHLILYLLRQVLPATEFFLRLPSLLGVELGLVCFYLTLRVNWGERMALSTFALAQVSPYLGFYALEARNYGIWFLFIGASFLAMSQWYASQLRENRRAREGWAISWGLINGLGLWTQVFHIFVVIGQVFMVVGILPRLRTRENRISALKSLLTSFCITLIVFAPWLPALWRQIHNRPVGVGWTREFSLIHILYYVYSMVFGYSFGPNLRELHTESLNSLGRNHWFSLTVAGLALIAVVILYGTIVKQRILRREKRWELLPLMIFPLCSVMGPLIFAVGSGFPLHPRHLLYLWPLLPLTLGLSWFAGQWCRAVVAFLALLQCVSLANMLFNPYYGKDDERGAILFAEQRSGVGSLVMGEGWVTTFYCKTTLAGRKDLLDFGPEINEVWFLDNRRWEPQNAIELERLITKLRREKFSYEGSYVQFRGVLLRHWIKTADSGEELKSGSPVM